MEQILEIRDLSVRAGQFRLEQVSLSLQRGDYFVLLGHSGAGKTLLLEAIAGIQSVESGSIIFEGRDIIRDRIQTRPFGLLFQDHAVFPHLRVWANIAYPIRHLNKVQRHRRIMDLAAKLDITTLLRRMPEKLSGGEKQRVALARILAREPAILLLDEPLSSLDVDLRKNVRTLLKRLHQEGQTIMHVTHDPEEALSLAQHVGILHQGKLVQQGKPEEVFANPRHAFVATFSGIHNYITANLADNMVDGLRIAHTAGGNQVRLYSPENPGDGHLLIRGEDIMISLQAMESSAQNAFRGKVKDLIPMANGMEVLIQAGDTFKVVISKESAAQLALERNKEVWLYFKATTVRFI